jgi:hypothetical protein
MISFVSTRWGILIGGTSLPVAASDQETPVGECAWCGGLNRVLYRDICYDCSPGAWREGLAPVLGEPTGALMYGWPWLAGTSCLEPGSPEAALPASA